MVMQGMTTKAKVGKKGNGMYFYIPKNIADDLDIQIGDTLKIGKEGHTGLFEKENTLTWESVAKSMPENYAETLRKESIPIEEIEEII